LRRRRQADEEEEEDEERSAEDRPASAIGMARPPRPRSPEINPSEDAAGREGFGFGFGIGIGRGRG
jgi:hypothetical protein